MIPLGLGGVNGILETTVIQGDVPLLLPIRLLRALDVILEKQKLQMILQRHQFVLDLHEMPSGHVTVGIFDFAKGDFRVPSEAGAKSEFVLGDGEHPEAMPAQALPVQFEHQAKSTTVLTTIHGGAAQTSDEVGGHQSNRGAPADVRRGIGGAESSARLAKLEHHGQSRPHSGVGRLSNYGGRMGLELDSHRLSSAGLEPEKLEDYYRMVIQSTPQLRPLKSKEPPCLAVSACIHPKNDLKGGGNAQASYIVCRACHARWENPMRASEARSILKEQNKGLLEAKSSTSRGSSLVKQAETAAERDVQMLQMLEPEEMVSNWPQVQQAFQTEMQASTQRIRKEIMEEQAQSNEELRQRESQRKLISQQLMGEIRRAREDAQEKELKQEKMMQMMLQAQEEMKQSQAAPRAAPMAVVAGAPASTWRKCHCGAAPEKF